MKLTIAKSLHTGIARKNSTNQDAIGFWKPVFSWKKVPIFVLADGMGGYAGGEIASHLVVNTVLSSYKSIPTPGDYLNALSNCILESHLTVRNEAAKNTAWGSMGSTVVSLILTPTQAYIGNVGDSRAYLIRDQEIQQLSHDHTVLYEQMNSPSNEIGEGLPLPSRNLLSMAISGNREEIIPYMVQAETKLNDIWMLCSDGLWSMVEDSLIAAVVSYLPLRIAARRLIEIANSRGGPDNISVILVKQGRDKPASERLKNFDLMDDKTDPGE